MAEKAGKHETICWKGEGAHFNPDNLKDTGYYFVYNPGAGTILVIAAFPGGRHPMQIFVPYNYSGIRTRSFNTDDGTWSAWVEMYHSGNLKAATQGAAGLMSATDKTKLDRIANGLIAAGRASREGGFIKRFGPHANSIGVTHSGNGRYVILHNLGHTEYVANITPCERYDNAWQLGATIIAETPNYVELWITENEYTHPADFNFEITGRL